MKYHYNRYKSLTFAVIIALAIGLSMSSIARAETLPAREPIKEDICSRTNELNSKVENSLSNKQQDIEKHRKQQSKKIQANYEDKTAQISSLRSQWDKNRRIHYEKLNEKASTQEQESAIEEFKNTIESAVAKRRALFDRATHDYRNSIDFAINNKQNGVDEIVSTYKSNINRAQEQLSKDCQESKSDAEIRSNFNQSMQEAKSMIANNTKGVDQIALQVNQAKQSRLDAIEQAISEFKSTLESAKEKLRIALLQ